MSALAPSWAFSAQAISSGNDPHLAQGTHVRLFLHPLLGLPIFPFRVYRVVITPETAGFAWRTDSVVWTDSSGGGGGSRVPPFDVKATNAVTAWFPAPNVGTCCWAEVDVDIDIIPPKIVADGPSRAAAETDTAGFTGINHFDMQAMVKTDLGPAVVSTANARPWQMSASRIDRIGLQGEGKIWGMNWLDAGRLISGLNAQPWRMWSLPVPSGPVYSNVSGFLNEANARVMRGAPRKSAMYDAITASGPGSSPLINSPGQTEFQRINAVSAKPIDWLTRLVNATKPYEVIDTLTLRDDQRPDIGQVNAGALNSVLASCLEAGMARFCGFSDVDEHPEGDAKSVVAYVIRGGWQLNLTALNNSPFLKGMIPESAKITDLASILPQGVTAHPQQQGPYLDMCTVAVASKAQSPYKPAPPALKTVVAGPWMPLTPPAAEREMTIRAEGLEAAAGVAMVRRDSNTLVRLNPPLTSNLAMPLIPSQPEDTVKSGVSDFFDHHATPATTGYRFAQCDWFGRWSEWSEIAASTGARPKPPRPTLVFDYTPPAPSFNNSTVPLSGTILLKAPIPKLDTLPPGSLTLLQLEVSMNGIITTKNLPATPPADGQLEIIITGPAIARAGFSEPVIFARWVNTANVKSEPSETIKRKLWDPRPPEQVSLGFSLEYGSRPDITGKSRMELRWDRIGVQKRFRVFYADETGIIGALEKIKQFGPINLKPRAIDILNKLKNAKTIFERSTILKDNRDFLTRDMFELLTGAPIEADENGKVRYVHLVSGSLRVLSLFRIVAVTEANIETDFTSTLLIPYAVPNSPRPAQPLIDVEPFFDDGTSLSAPARRKAADILPPQTLGDPRVLVKIRVPLGTAQAVGYRLRRSSSSAADPMRMPVVRAGLVPPPQNGDMQQIEITDTNAEAIADAPGKLKFWNTYLWRVETRAAAEPVTNGPEGEWSPASTPVSLTLVPPAAPPPVSNLTTQVDSKTRKVTIVATHPLQLKGGAAGRYKIDVYRQLPGDREKYMTSIFADAPPAKGGQDVSGIMRIPDPDAVGRGTRYRVIVNDPMGRSSEPSIAAQV